MVSTIAPNANIDKLIVSHHFGTTVHAYIFVDNACKGVPLQYMPYLRLRKDENQFVLQVDSID